MATKLGDSQLSISSPKPQRQNGPDLLHHLVWQSCEDTAVEFLDGDSRTRLTYQELHDEAQHLARRITASLPANAEGFVVPLLMHQSPLLYVAQLAILKAGGAFCPLNTDVPPERLEFILEDVSARVVIVAAELRSRIPPDISATVLVANEDDVPQGPPKPQGGRCRQAIPTDLAYVMYTSGSTGTPKGVGLSHEAVTQALLAHDRHIPPFSRFLQFAAPTFDVSVFEIFFPLFKGKTLITVRREQMLNDLPAVLRTMEVDACELTPTVAGSLLRKRERAPGLNLLLTIGEMLTAPVIEEFGGGDNRKSILWAMYGPTEATIHCTLQPAIRSDSSVANIGIPLDTVSCFVIAPNEDDQTSVSDLEVLPLGQVGELAVGGHQLATGYLNRPEQTQAAFVDSPHGRLYRTGDKARMREDGTLECLGRISEGQVKLRGQRMELGEVEQAVLRTSGCHGAVAAVVDSMLVVFCTAEQATTEEAILSTCRRWLPQFMVPAEIILMVEFPRLPSGKADRKQLKVDFEARKAQADGDLTLPSALGETEARILDILGRSLGARVSLSNSLASVGLDSLKAILAASLLREGGFQVTASELLASTTVSDLVARVADSRAPHPQAEAKPLSLYDELEDIVEANEIDLASLPPVQDVLPCTELQAAMLAETAQDSQLYCNSIELEIDGTVSPQELMVHFRSLVARTELLRSGFLPWKSSFVIVVFEDVEAQALSKVDSLDETFSMHRTTDWIRPLSLQVTDTRALLHIHHALYDGWSLDGLVADWSALLRGQTIGDRPSFQRVLEFDKSDLRRKMDDDARAFWSSHLLGWNKAPFPRLRASPPSDSINVFRHSLSIPVEAIAQAAAAANISPQVFFQAATAMIWSRVLGHQDTVIGSVTSGRTVPVSGIDSVFGPCIASLPLRVNIESIDTVHDLLNNIHGTNRAVLDHCTLSLLEIRKLLGMTSVEPLYDILLVYQESLESSKKQDSNLVRQVRHLDRLETRVLVEVEPQGSVYNICITQPASHVSQDLLTIIMQQMSALLRGMIQKPDSRLEKITAEAHFSPSVFNMDILQYQLTTSLADSFQASASTFPERVALRFVSRDQRRALTYSEVSYRSLGHRANQVAHWLWFYGVKPGEVVAVVMEKSVNLYVSILGIIKAGCGYLPVLPSNPQARIEEIFRQARTTHCVVDPASFEVLGSIKGAITFLVATEETLDHFPTHDLNPPRDQDGLAYVIYTSGTTGVPKGVAVTTGNIVSNITHLASVYPIRDSSNSRLLQACSQAFDVSVFEIFFTWHTGMCLCAGTNDIIFENLEQTIRHLDITHLSLTPTVAALIDPKEVPSVEFLVTAGEPMTRAVAETWLNKLWQGYGPSETTNICSVKHMSQTEYIEHLGWVFPNTSVAVLVPGGITPVPIGWVGEFCFGGEQVAQGYLNEPVLTERAFITHPQFGRIYRSGDMGRMLPDGSLVILGRLDGQVKLRGQRIETLEVNSAITNSSLANAAVTLVLKMRDSTREQLVSFYAPGKETTQFKVLKVDEERHRSLYAQLQSRLPSYMVPSFLVPVSQVPLTSSGKVDRRGLASLFQDLTPEVLRQCSPQEATASQDSEWTSTERLVAVSIERCMHLEEGSVGRWTPFATVGLDSVTAIGVAREVSRQLGQIIPLSVFVQSSSVVQLVKHVEERCHRVAVPESTQLDPQTDSMIRKQFQGSGLSVEDILPCTPLQEGMLVGYGGSYSNKTLLRLKINPEVMMECWERMVQRHQILRTCFCTTKSTRHPIVQVVLQSWALPWKTYEATGPSFQDVTEAHLNTIAEPLDGQIPPFSLALITYRSSKFLSLVMHHALYDGVAMESLWREVEALAAGRALPPPVPFSSFVRRTAIAPHEAEGFWARHFRGYQPATLFAKPRTKSHGQAKHTASLGLPLRQLRQRLQKNSFSLLALCQASWARAIAITSDLEDVCIGNVLSGRTIDIEGIDRLVGPCFNTLPIRVDIEKTSQNAGLVKHLSSLHQDMLEYQYTPLRKIQQIAETGGRALFDTLLLLQQPLKQMDESIWTLEEDVGDMDIPLVCEIVPCPELNSVIMHIHYEMDTITEKTATTMLNVFQYVLKDILDRPFSIPAKRSTLPPPLSSALQGLSAKVHPRVKDQALLGDGDNDTWLAEEQAVRQVLSDLTIVPLSRIARSTTIFQLGLDSINAVQVASSLRQKGLNVTSSDVLESRTCAGIAKKSEQNRVAATPERASYDLNAFQSAVRKQTLHAIPSETHFEFVLPCTPMQSAMISAFQQSEGRDYLNSVVYEMDIHVPAEDLVKALAKVQHIHPMLRTGFFPIQHPDCTFAMVRYLPEDAVLPSIVWEKESSSFDPEPWKDAARKEIYESLLLPPWRVALVVKEAGLEIHLLVHHALYDAQSLDMFLQDLVLVLNQPTTAPTESREVDTAVASILATATRDNDQAQAFYSSKAASTVINAFPVLTPLRVDNRAVLVHEQSLSYGVKDFQKLVQSQNLSMQAVVQAAWVRVLSSYLGEASVVFGVTLSGRTDEAISSAPFPCIATMPVVAVNKQSNRELLEDMMEYTLQAHKYQQIPLAKVQKWLGHPATAVFDTLLAYQRTVDAEEQARPWRKVADDAKVEYPLSVEVEPNVADQVVIRITYFDDILSQEQAGILAQQIRMTMEHLAIRPDGVEQDLHRIHPEIFSVMPAVHEELPAPVEYLHQFVEQAAFSTPDKIALEFVSGFKDGVPMSRSWTYAQLNDRGTRVAYMLKGKATPGSIIAIHFDKCPEAYFSILGILKAGCSFVALDITAPAARKEFILKDSEAPFILTLPGGLPDLDTSADVIQVSEAVLDASSLEPFIIPSLSIQDTCYCLYTSGTTGTPKGCEITHENAVQAMMAFQELFQGHWAADSRWLQFAALHFDVSVLEQYWSWSVGITVVAATKDLILDDLTGNINRMGITHIDLTPSLARLTDPISVPSLCKGVFITGGESLKQEILDIWGPKAVIYNAYGPTEATIGVTMYQRVPQNGRPSNIGRQFPNVGSYVFAPGTETPVFRGGVGELCVSGKLVGKGYLKRSDLTKERFPSLEHFDERVYRTGDLVRLLHDGCFEFLGRADDQVKLRGQRLEIGEINHAIRSQVEAISDVATVVARHSTSGKDVLISFFVTDEDRSAPFVVLPDGKAIGPRARYSCRETLPGYMVPSYFLRLGYIPLSSNNKAEGKLLRGLFQNLSHEELARLSAPTHGSSYTNSASASKVISALRGFHAIKDAQISAQTSLFDVGIDSISALQLSMFLRGRGFSDATPATILRNPIIADLAEALEKGSKNSSFQDAKVARQSVLAAGHRYRATVCRELEAAPHEIEYIAPCSALQQGIISKTMTSSEKGAYFNTFTMIPSVDMDMGRLKSAWAELVASEAILRTEFVKTPDGYIQVALRNKSVPWIEDNCLEDLPTQKVLDEKRHNWIDRNDENITRPLELLVVSGPKDRRVIIHIFHAIYDGNSFELMMKRLGQLYARQALSSGPSYLDALVHGPLLQHDYNRPFWTDFLAQWAPSTLPRLNNHANPKALSARHAVDLQHVDRVRRHANVTLQSVILAAWTSVIQRYFGSQTTIGVILSGRSIDLAEAEHVIGPLFNTLPFFNASLGGQSWRSLIHTCHNFHTEVLPFQHVPLKSVQRWCSKGKALFDNLFAFQVEHAEAVGDDLWSIDDGGFTPDYPLAFEATRSRDDRIHLMLVSQSQFANQLMLERWLEDVKAALHAMGVDLDALVDPDSKNLNEAAHQVPQHLKSLHEQEKPDSHEPSFEWTPDAVVLRSTIAALAGVTEEQVTPTITLIALGLDSVDVVKLSAQLRSQGIWLPASQMTRLQTIAAMVQHAATESHATGVSDKQMQQYQATKSQCQQFIQNQSLEHEMEIQDVICPTALQESMIAGMLQSGFENYFSHDILEIPHNVDIERLTAAWAHVVEASPILRAGVAEVDDQDMDLAYCLVIRRSVGPVIGHVDISNLSEATVHFAEAKQLAMEGKGLRNLFQLRIAHMGQRHFILLSIAHAMYDAWSLSLMFKSLQQAYNGGVLEVAPLDHLLPKTIDQALSASGAFWARYLENIPPTLLSPRSNDTGPDHLYQRQFVSSISLKQLKEFCRTHGISIQTLCQAAWAALLAHRTGHLDVCFGVVLSGRDFPGAEELMFPTINTVAVRCILHGTSEDLLHYLEQSMRDVREHQKYPLRKALHAAGRHSELFNSLFMMQKRLEDSKNSELLTSVNGEAKTGYPVCVEAEVVERTLMWRVACHSKYFTEETTTTLMEDLNTVLSFLTSSEPQSILDFTPDGVFICGLPAVQLEDHEDMLDSQPPDKANYKPLDATELAILDVLSKASHVPVDSISPSSTLSSLGLDSISAVKVSLLLRKEGIELRPRELLRAQDINEMASLVRNAQPTSEEAFSASWEWHPPEDVDTSDLLSRLNLTLEDIETILPAAPMQVYMLSAWENSDHSVFFPEFCFELRGMSQLELVLAAWQTLVIQAPILRTVFLSTGLIETPFMQAILKTWNPRDSTEIQPLVRLGVEKQGDDPSFVLKLKIHHALYDGVSLPNILQIFVSLLYGQEDQLPASVDRWAQYCVQPTWTSRKEDRKRFWIDYLRGCSTSAWSLPDLPTHDTHERVSLFREAAIPDTARLRKTAAGHRVTIQALVFAAYAKILSVMTQSSTVVFGIYVANRTSTDNSADLFPTLTLVPLKVAVGSSSGLAELSRSIGNDLGRLTARDETDVGLWEVKEWTGVEVTSFVNFLALPGEEESSDTGKGTFSSGNVVLSPLKHDQTDTHNRSIHEHTLGRPNAVKTAFPSTTDIEVKVREEGMDIGVFGERSTMDEKGAIALIEKLVTYIEEAFSKS